MKNKLQVNMLEGSIVKNLLIFAIPLLAANILQLLFKLPNDGTPLLDFSKYQYVFDNDNMTVNFNLLGNKSIDQFQVLKVKEVYNYEDYTVLHATPDVDYFDQFGQWQSLSHFVVHRDKQVFPHV